MKTFLSSMTSLDSGCSSPVALASENVIDYFIAKGDRDDKLVIVAEIAAFMASADIGDWRSFEGFGFGESKTLTLVRVRSDKPGIKTFTR